MRVPDLERVRAAIGDARIEVLTDVFRQSIGSPPGVPIARYRADHRQWLDILDRLESEQLFLKRSKSGTEYQIRVYGLPIIQDEHAKQLLDLMGDIYTFFRTTYVERLTEPIKVSEIVETVSAKADQLQIKKALYYMTDGHAIWSGLANDFPYKDDSYICVAESVLRHENFPEVLHEFYQWHILNPKRQIQDQVSNRILKKGSSRNRKRKASSSTNKTKGFLSGEVDPLPEWYAKLNDVQKALITELDKSIHYGLAALPTMGLRTLVELIMLDQIEDKGSFKRNLEAFQAAGYVTKQHAALIESVVDAGHAAIHRAYFPNPSDLYVCIETVRHLMEGIYILKPKLDEVATNTPKRHKPQQ
jgi:hypothetical protein